jgi:hypothetical protein
MACRVQATVVRWVDDDPFPGTVEVQLVDGLGRTWQFVDKWPMFGSDDLSPTSIFPLEITLPVTIVRHDDSTVTVSTATPCMVETVDGVQVEYGSVEFTRAVSTEDRY